MAPPKAPARPKTVSEYIAAAPKETRPRLRELRKCIRAAAPGAVESLKWGMPAYSYKRILVIYGAFKRHVSFFPTPSAVRTFKKELAKYNCSSATIQFPLDRPLPLPLIRKITAYRVRESIEKDGKWRPKSRD
ncbi:MAG TPA: DUF1801 domain-containing protein [Lacunisphaera sp.]